MKTNTSTLLLATAALCAWPLTAAAQQDAVDVITSGEVEAGVGAVSDDSFYFNEYTGITDTDPYFFGNMLFQQRAAYDSDSTRYVEFQAYDLGLPTQSVYIEAGRQGSFSFFGEYDAIPHLRFNDGQTPYSGAGTGILTLPPGWVPQPDAT
jgi:opacity protein-like surface antigen